MSLSPTIAGCLDCPDGITTEEHVRRHRRAQVIEVDVEVPGEAPLSWTFGLDDRFAPEIATLLLCSEGTRPIESLTANLTNGGTVTWRLAR